MSNAWRQTGWQRIRFLAPSDWFYSKIGLDPASGDLWLADAALPRLQIKWTDVAKQKQVDPAGTLDQFLKQMERQAKRKKLDFSYDRDTRLVSKSGRNISSLESFHWTADVETHGAIWYCATSARVMLCQVNGEPGEKNLKATARRVLNSIENDPAEVEEVLWTAYDLECRLPTAYKLTGQTMETGHTELKFTKGPETITVARYGLASIALARADNLGDWAHDQRHKPWLTFRLDRDESPYHDCPAVAFAGRKRSFGDRARARIFNFFGASYIGHLSARAWHCVDSNCIILVEHHRDARSEDRLDAVCETVPCVPADLPTPR